MLRRRSVYRSGCAGAKTDRVFNDFSNVEEAWFLHRSCAQLDSDWQAIRCDRVGKCDGRKIRQCPGSRKTGITGVRETFGGSVFSSGGNQNVELVEEPAHLSLINTAEAQRVQILVRADQHSSFN